jgi:predicted molibdopterin-dependent oxidoreductase YjgC
MFKAMPSRSETQAITIIFNGRPLKTEQGISVAAALLAHDVKSLRHTPKGQNPRGPFCMMGACFDCLVQIDGVSKQACMTQVEEGLEIMSLPKHSETLSENAND